MPTTIAVTGRAEERVEPELGAVSLAVSSSGPDRDRVLAAVGETHERLLAAIRELDGAGALESWSAGQLRVWSHRPWNEQGRQLPLVHQASAELEVVFRDLEALGAWVGPTSAASDVTVQGVEWRLTDASRSRVQEAAQRAAVADAVRKAAVYAEALGLGAPTPVELADHGLLQAQPIPRAHKAVAMRAMAMDASDAGPAPEFAPAKLVVEASVDARFTAG
ncbi:SIMPL domain-containing protein [Agromyces luteolus]|uniref:SIMPL domain-containing protein n=1 Tax=Agromyces luteolus TaxID=88373 RepID=UPI00141366C8|nr:SIMPL domain-containing protein [Agromyces luteolus]GLK27228.1 SIMPL domain-containing protein [Agromyces luteolus]